LQKRGVFMKKALMSLGLMVGWAAAQAQGCEGGLYLNPQLIRGEAPTQTESTLNELIDFLRPSGLPVTPVVNIKETQEVIAALQKPRPPCWVYGNPVVGLASGYAPVAVNTQPIQAAVLVFGDAQPASTAKITEIKSLPPAEQAKVLAKLKTASCFGIKSGVTTALVKAAKLCGEVVEILPQQGMGQTFLPTKAGFHWRANRWAGMITRLSSVQPSFQKNAPHLDERDQAAQVIVVPVELLSWGYGLYVRPGLPPAVLKKVVAQFESLKTSNTLLLRALDVGSDYAFLPPDEGSVQKMKKALALAP
jgi:hypothetical protein